jgi:hypothetical protein
MVFLFKPKKLTQRAKLLKRARKLKLKRTSGDYKSDLHDIISLYSRELNDWRCSKCGKQHERGSGKLGASHYISRGCLAFAWDLKNIDPLCWFPCHQRWESMKNTEYKRFMINKLGEDAVRWMELIENIVKIISLQDSVIKSMPQEYLNKLLIKMNSNEISRYLTYYIEAYKQLCITK